MSRIPRATRALVNGKFGLANAHSLIVNTSVVNPGFRGRVKVVMQNFSDKDYDVKKKTTLPNRCLSTLKSI